ncbi:TniQ family protein [Meridianimarinicoccus roseus]|uniref:TniQ family protein n=1 Tax=Meridianimarinicoccus roseus TaxID=2072018 RepID=UPI002379C6ED|nr:TniQ family protein [Meridianimarinicoccus roseus]
MQTPRPAPRETVYSYLSRVAATWRTGTVEFAHDIGAPFKYFLEEKPEAFDALATWANLTSEEMDTLLSWTGQRIGDVGMKFRGEVIVSRALRNPQIRGCPVCLREDAGGQDGPAIAAMVMRGDWQLREAYSAFGMDIRLSRSGPFHCRETATISQRASL